MDRLSQSELDLESRTRVGDAFVADTRIDILPFDWDSLTEHGRLFHGKGGLLDAKASRSSSNSRTPILAPSGPEMSKSPAASDARSSAGRDAQRDRPSDQQRRVPRATVQVPACVRRTPSAALIEHNGCSTRCVRDGTVAPSGDPMSRTGAVSSLCRHVYGRPEVDGQARTRFDKPLPCRPDRPTRPRAAALVAAVRSTNHRAALVAYLVGRSSLAHRLCRSTQTMWNIHWPWLWH